MLMTLRITAFTNKKCKSRQNFRSAASVTQMSMPPKPPKRLTEILMEILALSDPTRGSESESPGGSDPIENLDPYRVEEQSQRKKHKDSPRNVP
jgi:hypothetical protein